MTNTALQPDTAQEILRVAASSVSHIAEAAAARGAEAGWANLGHDAALINQFFANCAYFGINNLPANRPYSAESGRAQLSALGVLNDKNELDVGTIARIAGPTRGFVAAHLEKRAEAGAVNQL